ncbi:hypothetical protein ONE63_005149 [Megalurothrips usitatus]|uniref:Uncharacterized protein n=1 Tax=Megalurothrips usitatus TaxID=439358 RepID=A0AAV7XX21_9NEOP|nr:hypothetical protein ONE63_005149 [Megalurothrips usitatus]
MTQMYQSRLATLMGVKSNELSRAHSTRLQERILQHVPELVAKLSQTENYYLVPNSPALYTVALQDDDFDDTATLFSRFARRIREILDASQCVFTGSSTAEGSFHGTGISILQMRCQLRPGEQIVKHPSLPDFTSSSTRVPELPDFFEIVKPVVLPSRKPQVPVFGHQGEESFVSRLSFLESWKFDEPWLNYVQTEYQNVLAPDELNLSWSAIHASRQKPPDDALPGLSALLPLFPDDSTSPSMICHRLDIGQDITQHVNPGQTPVMCGDQPIYAMCKIVQWNWPDNYGEDKYFIMFGEFRIEQSFLKLIGHAMGGCGWVSIMAASQVVSSETAAQSLLAVHHVKKSRSALAVTAAALFVLLNEAHQEENAAKAFDSWIDERCRDSDTFYYWFLIFNLIITLLRFVKALRLRDYNEYCQTLKAMAPWYFTYDRQNYARWIPVHIRDLERLPEDLPAVYEEFKGGNFVFLETLRLMSAIPYDQTHEHINDAAKVDGRALGLKTQTNSGDGSLRRQQKHGNVHQKLISANF